jgi:hypothetical protein
LFTKVRESDCTEATDSAPVGRPLLTAGVALMVRVSVYFRRQSARLTWVGPVGTFPVASQAG